jgi:RNA polymerase sigma-70 factor (ECF subfamily)
LPETSLPRATPGLAAVASVRPTTASRTSGDDFAARLVALLPELRGRGLRLTGSAARAEDLAQDTLERALRFRHQYIAGSNLRAWTHQVLFSVFVTGYRRQRRERRALTALRDDPFAWTAGDDPTDPAAEMGLTSRTRRELEGLPEGFRTAIVLVDLEERSYREAAAQLGVPLGTVMSRLHRGRKLLADRLREAA